VVESFGFPAPPRPDAMEWPGTPIGTGNVITRSRRPAAARDAAVDRVEGRRDELVGAAVEHIVERARTGPVWIRDAVIHGVRARLVTDSPHLQEFWTANWHGPQGWRRAAELVPPPAPALTTYAIAGAPGQPQAAAYSRRTNTIVLLNTSYYGDLRALVLGAVGRMLAEERGVHTVRGTCVTQGGRGVLLMGPSGIGKSALGYGMLAERPDTALCADGWVHLRYTIATRDGRRLAPFEVRPVHGRVARGHRVYRWLEEHRGASGEVRGTDLRGGEVRVPLGMLDLGKPVEAYAYPAERAPYARTALVAAAPDLAAALLRARFENIPDVTPEDIRARAPELQDLAAAVLGAAAGAGSLPGGEGPGGEGSHDALERWLARLTAFDGARAVLDVSAPSLGQRIAAPPMTGVLVSTVLVVRRDPTDRAVLGPLAVEPFLARLLLGEPDRAREVAYNPDRAVDAAVEAAALERLQPLARSADGPLAFYREFPHQVGVPETLAQEFEFFRLLHGATRCYDLNAILTLDPEVRDVRQAVARTAALAARATAPNARASLDDYGRVLAAAVSSS
jgi:hypothetical protein